MQKLWAFVLVKHISHGINFRESACHSFSLRFSFVKMAKRREKAKVSPYKNSPRKVSHENLRELYERTI